MKAADTYDRPRGRERMLVVDPDCGCWAVTDVQRLADTLEAGDLVVVNDAATLPASLRGTTADGTPVELRIMGPPDANRWPLAVLDGQDWRTPTQDRHRPPILRPGQTLRLSGGLEAEIQSVQSPYQVLATIRGGDVWAAVFRTGRPVQYAYMRQDVPLGAVQTAFATRPWAAEMPSAARPLTWSTLLPLRRRGVGLARLTHAAGLSSVDGGAVDATLPLPERSDIPAETVRAIRATRAGGGRVLAVGTTVTRALEGRVAAAGDLVPGVGTTDLILEAGSTLQVVDGLLSNLHEPGESHFSLFTAFAEEPLLRSANALADRHDLRAHEFGDATLILAGALARIPRDACLAA